MRSTLANLFAVATITVAGCSAADRPTNRPTRVPPPKSSQNKPDPAWPERPAAPAPPTPRASVVIDESVIAEHGGVVVPDGSVLEPGAPTTEEQVQNADEEPQADEPEPQVVASIPKSESLLPRIKTGTPPKQAAGLRLIDQGRQLLDQGQLEPATEKLERGVAIDPTNAYGYYYLAKTHYLQKNFSQAVAFAGRAVSLSARTDRAWQSRAYSLQAAIFEEVGRFPDARASYTKAVSADPSNLSARAGAARLNSSGPAENAASHPAQ